MSNQNSDTQAQVFPSLSITVALMSDGTMRLGPNADSPRQPTLDDLHTIACRIKRDVEAQLQAEMTAAKMTQLLSESMGHAQQTLTEDKGK